MVLKVLGRERPRPYTTKVVIYYYPNRRHKMIQNQPVVRTKPSQNGLKQINFTTRFEDSIISGHNLSAPVKNQVLIRVPKISLK